MTIGSLIIDLAGTTVTAEDKEILSHPLVGGVVLFTRNYATRAQLTTLCQQIRASRTQPLLIMVDQEGGRVQRFVDEFTKFPPMGELGDLYQHDPVKACQEAQAIGEQQAKELLSVGINMNLAPVLDLDRGLNTVIGNRAFHHDPVIVTKLAAALMLGMQTAGMAATGKHFPGHGGVTVDSHLATPIDTRSFQEIAAADLVPFTHFIKAKIAALMPAHIIFPDVDESPVGFSAKWLQQILRKQLQFTGTIFSDDLSMAGANISAAHADRVEAARAAGCDFALLCNHRQGVIQTIDNVSHHKHQVAKEKWGLLYGKNF